MRKRDASVRSRGLAGVRGRTLDDTRHDANLTPTELQALNGSAFSKRNSMVDRTAKLEAALRVQAKRLIAAYVAPEPPRRATQARCAQTCGGSAGWGVGGSIAHDAAATRLTK
jgi:hypothetical protein